MPTYEQFPRFRRDYQLLSPAQRRLFDRAIAKFVTDLRSGRFRKGLRVKGLQGYEGIFEMTWAPDGRATFRYGAPLRENDLHVIWLRIGSHDIFNDPE